MSRYIDADALKEYIGSVRAEFNFFDDDERARYEAHSKAIYLLDLYVNDAPSIDIEPKRGEWIYGEHDVAMCDGYRCNRCDFFVPWDYEHKFIDFINDYHFCPNCGADMRGADDE